MAERRDEPPPNGQHPSSPIRLLFVCIGNICRSPMAAGLARRMLEGRAEVESAGIAPYGDGATEEAIQVMQQEGIDLTGHTPKDVATLSLRDFDCIVAMDPLVHRFLNEQCRVPRIKLIAWDIQDPFGQDVEVYQHSLQAIRTHLEDFMAELGLPRQPQSP